MNKSSVNAMKSSKMVSGHLCLNLSDSVKWDEFPEFAEWLLGVIGGDVVRKSDAPDLRLWEISFPYGRLSLVFDDFPQMVSLESSDEQGDKLIQGIKARLLE